MLKKRYLFLIMFVCFFAISAVSAEDNSTSDIVSLSNDVNSLEANSAKDEFSSTNYIIDQLESDSGNGTGTFHDLQVEINNAPKGSVLNLTRDYKGAYGSSIEFNKDLTINGQGHTLDCLNTECSAFYSSSGSITLMNLKIINGHNDDNAEGGAIHISGSAQYKIINCTFNNNWADNYGGAIYNEVNKPLTIINSTFNNNKADNYDGGAIYTVGDVYIENSIFNSNIANRYAGAIFCDNAYITHCLLDSNKVKGARVSQCEGGAICCKDDLTVDNSTFKNNYAGDYGGAICAGTLDLKPGCIFVNNTAYDNQGGAIWVNKFREDVKYATFINNKAGAKDDGGAIYINKENHVTFSHCTFKGNYAGDEGGAIYLDSTSSELTLKDNSFIDNFAGAEGLDVFNKGTYRTIEHNWWGTASPDFCRGQLFEGRFLLWKSNLKHFDSNPLKSAPNELDS